MINFILIYRIRKKIKSILKEKEKKGEIDFSNSCLDCIVNELAWGVYYLIKEKEKNVKEDNSIE